jgi:hypothetical protein
VFRLGRYAVCAALSSRSTYTEVHCLPRVVVMPRSSSAAAIWFRDVFPLYTLALIPNRKEDHSNALLGESAKALV